MVLYLNITKWQCCQHYYFLFVDFPSSISESRKSCPVNPGIAKSNMIASNLLCRHSDNPSFPLFVVVQSCPFLLKYTESSSVILLLSSTTSIFIYILVLLMTYTQQCVMFLDIHIAF